MKGVVAMEMRFDSRNARQGCHRFGSACVPGLSKARQTRSGLRSTLGLIDGTGLLHELLPRLFVALPFEFLTALVGDIAQLVFSQPLANDTLPKIETA